MTQTIKAEEHELRRVFGDDYVFEIPPYQRPYAWGTEQTGELLDDIMAAMDRRGPKETIENIPPYFLGSIVLIKDPDLPPAEVVDGQQRLTTLTILFCVLRELFENSKHRDGLDNYVREKGDIFAGNEDRFRLTLRERDQDFFRKNVQTSGNLKNFLEQRDANFTDSQSRIYENAEYLWKKLSKEDSSKLERLTQFLVRRCYLVIVSASDLEAAYRIFSVMNDRGLNLSPTDILKADIIGAVKEKERPKYTDRWEEIEESLGRDDFGELFAHIRMIYAKNKAQVSLNQEFKSYVLEKSNGHAFIDEILMPYAEAYHVVSNASYASTSGAESMNACLNHLGRLDNSNWMPPAILYFKKFRHEQELLLRFIRDLERLAYFLFVTRANVNERIYRYADVLRAIEEDKNLYEDSPIDLCSLQLWPREKETFLEALNGPVYKQTRVRLPLLLRLDSALADVGATYEHKKPTVEHVLPQTPADGSEWLNLFPAPDERNDWTHKIANLVLLSHAKNSQAQNFDFERKKQEYFQKGNVVTFALTSQVLSREEWTPAVLEERQQALIERLKNEWRLE